MNAGARPVDATRMAPTLFIAARKYVGFSGNSRLEMGTLSLTVFDPVPSLSRRHSTTSSAWT